MSNIVINKTSFLDAPLTVDSLHGVTFTNENGAHKFVISCMQSGELKTLTGSVSARFMRANNTTILLSEGYASIEDGKAVVTLHQDCYNVPGRFQLAIFNTADNSTVCIYACVGTVQRSQNGDLIDSGDVVPSIDELLAQIEACQTATTAATNAASAANAAAESASTAGESKFVRYDAAQALTASQQAQARANIGASTGAVLYSETQTLTDAEKATARGNVSAASATDVDDLKSALNANEVYGTIKIESAGTGAISNSDGTIIPNTGVYHTDFIDISGFKKLIVSGPATISANAFYDSDKAYVGGFTITRNEQEIEIPVTAMYIRVSAVIANFFGIKIKDYTNAALADTNAALADTNAALADTNATLDTIIVEDVYRDRYSAISYTGQLGNVYLWLNIQKTIPDGSSAIFKMKNGRYAGSVHLVFFTKNANGTYALLKDIPLTFSSPNEEIEYQHKAYTEELYFGFYSDSNGVCYGGESSLDETFTRCQYSAISSATTMSGSYNMVFWYKLTLLSVAGTGSSVVTDKNYVVVDINGRGDYTSLLTAMQNEPEGTVIYVLPGVYNQDMTSCLEKRVIVIGADRNQCIIRDTDGRALHHPLYVSCGYFENLTIISEYVNGESYEIGEEYASYAVHSDTSRYGEGKQLEFHHCNIISDFFPAVGAGLFKDATLILDDCILENRQISGRGDYSGENEGTLGALYFHDSNHEQGDQYVFVKGCVLKSKLKYAMCPYQVSREVQNNHVICDFINNVLYSDVGKYTDTVWFRNNPFDQTTGIFELRIGYGNSIASLNN